MVVCHLRQLAGNILDISIHGRADMVKCLCQMPQLVIGLDIDMNIQIPCFQLCSSFADCLNRFQIPVNHAVYGNNQHCCK